MAEIGIIIWLSRLAVIRRISRRKSDGHGELDTADRLVFRTRLPVAAEAYRSNKNTDTAAIDKM